MPNARLQYLFDRHLAKACTEAEKQELAVMILSTKHEEDIKDLLQQAWDSTNATEDMEEEKAENIIHSILAAAPAIKQKGSKVRQLWKKVAAAAAVLLLASGGYFLLKTNDTKDIAKIEPQEIRFKNDVAAPANTKATITLADGKIVPIDSLTVLTQNGVNVLKTLDGKIIYNGSTKDMVYNTLSNPRGSKVIDMTLADGSHVWLNAGSSVTYPVAFIGNERNVSITGEAYFEVAPLTPKGGQGKIPFSVDANGVITEVLGTHFNVNSYSDEGTTKITLLEGSVKVSKGKASGLLLPGQQAQVALRQAQDDVKILNAVDLNEVMAWKNGRFYFDGVDIKVMMRQLSRWYNVEVEYKADIKSSFVAKISRDEPVTELLKILELTNLVHFKIEGNKIEVIK